MGLGNTTSDFDFDCSSIDALDNPAVVTGDEEDVNERSKAVMTRRVQSVAVPFPIPAQFATACREAAFP